MCGQKTKGQLTKHGCILAGTRFIKTMISTAVFRKLAGSFSNVKEQPHFDKASFRVKGKIFATLDSVHNRASLKLSAVEQSIYCSMNPVICSPATGAWGKQGWTVFDLQIIPKDILAEALYKAFENVAKAVKPK